MYELSRICQVIHQILQKVVKEKKRGYIADMVGKEAPIMWDNKLPGQFVLPVFDRVLGGVRWRGDGGRFPERRIVPPVKSKDPGWLRDHWDRMLTPHLPTYRERPAGVMLGERRVYTDLAIDPERDLQFIETMEKVRQAGGGIVIYLDPQDGYSDTDDGDRGYHYAMAGIDMTLGPEALREELWGSRDEVPAVFFTHFAGMTIPLPLLAQRLGFAEVADADLLSEDDIRSGRVSRRITADFTEIVRVLAEAFKGNVRFGIRSQKDLLFHFHRQELEPTRERVLALYGGPLLPESPNDEERIARFKQWLLEQDGRLLNAGDFYRLFFGQ